jgi:hypothetical protein
MPPKQRSTNQTLYGKGVSKTADGHLRYRSPKELRGKYVHRKVVEDLIAITHPLTIQLLPWPYEVHHMDFDKTHNQPSNLLVVSEGLHAYLGVDGRRDKGNGRFRPRWKSPPEWVLFREDDIGEIPF